MADNVEAERDIEALLAFIESRQQVPHTWGRLENDCCSFPIQAVEAMTGRNPCGRLTWSSRAGAVRVIKAAGGLENAIDRYFVRIPPSCAKRGDIAGVADATFGIHPMVVEGEMLVGPGDKGQRRLPRRMMVTAWSATLPKVGGL